MTPASCSGLAVRSARGCDQADAAHSFATHHWAHTWLGKNLGWGTVNVDEVVKKARGADGGGKAEGKPNG